VSFGVAIVGCGLIGQKRAKSLGEGRLVVCVDLDLARATSLAEAAGARATATTDAMLSMPEVDVVIVATLHDSLAEIAQAAIEAGKHVLVEKPAARSAAELEGLIAAAAHGGVKVRVGFNHRFHRAFRKSRELVDAGALGELMFVRARYGHGGRPGYDREWRADPVRSGGGELLDQGPHLIDLAGWFLGRFTDVQGFAHTYYWDMPVDDNAFLLLKTAKGQAAFLHVSCTEWKNTFSMEIYGRAGKLEISGLGGSYGMERVTFYKMLPEMGPPETTTWEYPMADDSWSVEIGEFYQDIRSNRTPSPGLDEAREVLSVIDRIYNGSES
jgi:predicted dehydrogenase